MKIEVDFCVPVGEIEVGVQMNNCLVDSESGPLPAWFYKGFRSAKCADCRHVSEVLAGVRNFPSFVKPEAVLSCRLVMVGDRVFANVDIKTIAEGKPGGSYKATTGYVSDPVSDFCPQGLVKPACVQGQK